MGEGGLFQKKYISPHFFLLQLTTLPLGGFLAVKFTTNSICTVHGPDFPEGYTHLGHTHAPTHTSTHTEHATQKKQALTVNGQWSQLLGTPCGSVLMALWSISPSLS